jgi:hypothetical protein
MEEREFRDDVIDRLARIEERAHTTHKKTEDLCEVVAQLRIESEVAKRAGTKAGGVAGRKWAAGTSAFAIFVVEVLRQIVSLPPQSQ